MILEFIDDSSGEADGSSDDLLDVGTDRRLPRWVVGLLVAALAAIAIVVIVHRQPATKPAPVAAPSSAVSTSQPPPTDPSQAASQVPSQVEETFSAIYGRARDRTPAEDVVRSGSTAAPCRLVRIGTSPQQAAAVALTRLLPGYRLVDSARIIDQDAGLCALQLRARDLSGTVAVVLVISPTPARSAPRPNVIQSHSAPIDGAVVEYVQFTTSDGWSVIVGTSGPSGGQPSTGNLGQLAVSPALRW